MFNWVCSEAFGESATFVLSHIYLLLFIFPPLRMPQYLDYIEYVGVKRWYRLGSDWVACIRIYVPLHSLGGYNVFVAKSEANGG